ncbi:phosphotransferase enzyme family protein [Nocardia sp. BMG111209]|uniref:phosphotransferase enzyme family protein n=1 Tax=Nocardia sp. BMG111209 TaxID=1160137 RepID=UPI0018C9A57D|nr:aminoglycoside phosphotransferase family protein [Nocardia sp. BMG111209]
MNRGEFGWLEVLLGRRIVGAAPTESGFRSRTDLLALADGRRVVLRRHYRRADVRRHEWLAAALRARAAGEGIAMPRITRSSPEADPTWAVFEALPGVPVTDELDSPRFPVLAWEMGAMLSDFAELPCDDLNLDETWTRPRFLAARADAWAECLLPTLGPAEYGELQAVLGDLPDLFEGRPTVLAHGDFVPGNILADGERVGGVLDFDEVRRADPLYDIAWWAWSVSFAQADSFAAAWPAFLDGAGIDPSEPALLPRIRALQVVRMVEMLAEHDLGPDPWRIVHSRLLRTLSWVAA